MIKDYLRETFEPTILYGLLCALVGLVAAYHYNPTGFGLALGALAAVGVMIAQISVNVLDDYVDFKSGLDSETDKTPFSGGSSLGDALRPKYVLTIGIAALLIALAIGVYLVTVVPNPILILMLFGGAVVILYARFITHIPFLAEPATAASFVLAGVGTFILAYNGAGWSVMLPVALLVFLAAGIQPAIALMVNEVPDRAPDKRFGRRSGIVMMRTNRGAAVFYSMFYAVVYGALLYGVLTSALPVQFLIALIMLVPNYIVVKGILGYKNAKGFVKTMAFNVLMTLAFILLLLILFVI